MSAAAPARPDDSSLPPPLLFAPPRPRLDVVGQDGGVEVHRVFCVGRNYAEHAVEMGHDPSREPPFFFLKPPTAVRTDGRFVYPQQSQDVHHEIELVVVIGRGGADIDAAHAEAHIYGYGVGIDMTMRDRQGEAKALGRPWDIAKGFDGSAPCGAITPRHQCGDLSDSSLQLDINGEPRQQGRTAQMLWRVPEIIAILSQTFTLYPGDLIMTGTPAGVGPVTVGDELSAAIDGLETLRVTVER